MNKVKSYFGEIWRDPELKDETKKKNYQFSNFGRFKSIDKVTGEERLLKGSIDNRGGIQFNLRLKNRVQGIYIARAVAEAFLERESLDQDYVIHLDFDKKNNSYKNLKWVTKKEWVTYNKKRSKALGISGMGQIIKPVTKLNEAQVSLIKRWLKKGNTKRKIIAKRFGISTTQLKRIERGENWGHVEPAED